MTMRTNRYDQRDEITEQPTPETPEPLEEEARRERALDDARRDEHEGPGPVYAPSDAYVAGYRDGAVQDTTGDTGDTAYGDGTVRDTVDGPDYANHADRDEAEGRFQNAHDRAGDDVLRSSDESLRGSHRDSYRDSRRDGVEGDVLVAGERTGAADAGAPAGYEPAGGDYTAGDHEDRHGHDDVDHGVAGDVTTPAADRDALTSAGTAADGPVAYPSGTTPDSATPDTAGTLDGPVAYPAATTNASGIGANGTGAVLDEALEGRWREIKSGFVDDPRQSVEQADALVEEALSAFTSRREALLGQWKDNERGDTEALRLALHEYRTLLAQLTRK
ncbi:hypothetical protein [Microbispora triticiradicis]|uniref:hypothetical protein n=1 Tax=Microbispora triticiradicis TaxID=2200763 RepID=UPI001AD743CE|nr:hypothetical protein [Microbispora triticiradicis]MBO4270217.1 hypothetical protein [Microbispora triticiradicis]